MEHLTSALLDLQNRNIQYKLYTYPIENGPVAALDVAEYLGIPSDRLIKTLVTTDHHGGYFVFCLPANSRIDMKKAAAVAGVKKLTLLDPNSFEELTGYVHGGCSPFGLKTVLPIFVEEFVFEYDFIYISGGKVGFSVEIEPISLLVELDARKANFTRV